MLDLLQKGGPIMWLIVACSVVALGVFLERLLYLHRASIAVGDLLRGLSNILRKGDYAEALQECATTPGPVARVAHAVILRHSRPRTELREIAEEAGQLEVPKLERNLPLLATIAYGTPLLGLLGTLLGLLSAFETIAAQSGYATAADIADGVYLSLLTSASSLAVAIPAFVAYSYLSARVNALIHDMERTGIEILGILDEVQGRKPSSAS
ncbi:MAG: flagellar motor protein MotA [Verrucomicrobia bacterium 61-8]|nr:MotA/TolQ/ExbB proton channel family protein [Verrucomicrobiota bacterium]OJV02657.1 MAG: flagellar motor protein MotA [Verrucomicrobia bacterium 61-8]